MKKLIVSAIIIAILISCGGPSHPILTGAKLEVKGKRHNNAYDKLSKGLYSAEGINESLKKIPEAWFEMAKLHMRKGETKKSISALESVVKYDLKKEWKL